MPTKETMDTIEQTLDVIEETLDTVERIPKLRLNGTTRKQQVVILGLTASVPAIAVGTAVYFLAKRRFKAKFEQIADEEIAQAKKHYSQMYKKDEFSSPTEALETLGEKSSDAEYQRVVKEAGYSVLPTATQENEIRVAPPAPVTQNIFTQSAPVVDEDFNYEEELKKRTEDAPYVITNEEYYQNEKDYQQATITYYEGDNVLADERDEPIPDIEGTVGDYNLERFGHGSKDQNVVFVRNDILGVEFEVLRSGGEYVKEVLGFIEHSEQRGRSRRFRGDDE